MEERRVKIAVLSYYSGVNKRGVEMWVYELFNRLSPFFDITVYQSGEKAPQTLYNVQKVKNVHTEKVNEARSLNICGRLYLDGRALRILLFTLKIIPALWRKNFDIIIATDGGWEPAIIRLLTWAKRKKMVIVGHSGVGWDERNNLFCFPDVFIALSEYAEKWAGKINPLIKITRIPNGVDLKKFSPDGERVNIGLERPIYLTVGALEKEKRIGLLIRAISKLDKGSLIILGKGSEEADLLDLAEKLLPGRFLIKSVSFTDTPKYFRSSDVFSLPSWSNEAFGIVILEALASGLPVVINNDPIRKEIVGDAGISVDPEDTVSYSKALRDVLKKDLKDLSLSQAEKFSWDSISGKYRLLLENLIKRI